MPHPRHDDLFQTQLKLAYYCDELSLFDKAHNEEWERIGAANTPLGLIHNLNFRLKVLVIKLLILCLSSRRQIDQQIRFMIKTLLIKQIDIKWRVIK